MHEKVVIALVCMLLMPGLAGPAFSQLPADNPLPDAQTERPPAAASIPSQIPPVRVENNLLSVEVMDTEFGVIMKEIAQQSGISVEISGDVSGRKVTTKFRDMDLERGIVRLLTLVKEKNYTMRYDLQGMIDKVEIYGSLSPGQPVSPVQPASSARPAPSAQRPQYSPKPQMQRTPVPIAAPRPQRMPPPVATPAPQSLPAIQKNPPPSRRILPPLRERREQANRQAKPEAPAEPAGEETPEEPGAEDPVETAPYIPPQRVP